MERTTNFVYPPPSNEPRICHDCGETISEVPEAYFTQCEKCMRVNND
ncbi:YhfH family protein [Salicibibacter halophilus]|uniref:YhfH family protein n=2 Tax=Salicibibacter halophilus TaxID=2502791 RepID=A0A514LMF4_9BACI|nr:YhfH family protein [Salicibibacter halophilus]